MNKETKENIKMQVYSKADLLEIFPFGKDEATAAAYGRSASCGKSG